MHTLTVSLPDTVQEFVQRQVTEGGYATASEYILALIGEAQKRKAKAKVEALLLEGLQSGEPIEVNSQYWEEKRCRLGKSRGKASNK
jgi:antitoxin ParD1/3/4